jgi:imidazolonepropionase-like amidohydrolase
VPADGGAFALTGATLIDGTGAPPAMCTVVVRGDRISEVFPAGARGLDGIAAIDLAGAFVTPGFIESHCHVQGLVYMGGESADGLGLAGKVMPMLPRYGIVAVRDTGGPDTDVSWDPMCAGKAGWPRFYGSGPVIDGWPGGPFPGLWKTTDTSTAENWVRLLAEHGASFIKTYVWISREVLEATCRQAHALGLKVAAHVGLEITAEIAIEAGVDMLEHVRLGAECAAPADREQIAALPHRFLDEIGDHRAWRFIDPDGPEVGRLIERMVERETFLTPTLAYSQSILEPQGTLAAREGDLNPDVAALRAMMPPESFSEEYTAEDRDFGTRELASILRFVGRAHEAGVRICAGTDSPSAGGVLPGIAYHDELELLVRAGLSPLEALRAATSRGAELLGIDDETGTVAPGKRADLVVLDADPAADIGNARSIRAVLAAGEQIVGRPLGP